VRLFLILGSIALALLPLIFSPIWYFSPDLQTSNPQLHLHRGSFDARTAGGPITPSTLATAAPGPYTIIQLRGPISLADRAALEQTGVQLLEYLPDYAYLVRGSAAQLEAAARLPQVYARTPFTLADKLAPALLSALARGDRDLGQVRLVGWPDDQGALAFELQSLGVQATSAADPARLFQLASLASVRWIEPVTQPRIFNDRARAIMQVEPVWQNRHWFGAGQIIAVADSGLDTGNLETLSPDFAGRIVATHIMSTVVSDWGDNFGHGTHVAGSVAGAGVQSGAQPAQKDYSGSFAGVAPEASLVVQAFDAKPDGTIIGLDPDYYQLFALAYADGARLHTNSWGDPTGPRSDPETAFGGYPYGSQRTDQFVWEHPDMTIFFAAGNSGVDGSPIELFPGVFFCLDGDGVVDEDSLFFPGTAKNVITVGAAESDRSAGGFGSLPWAALNFFCFGVAPIATDLIANNANGMAAFSSRGPADDGRIKPDIVAPGVNIISNRSHYPGASALWAPHETNAHYAYSGGTSMATPLAAGAGALVRQWLAGQGMENPSATAIKAVLLNTSHDMAPGQYGLGSAQEIPFDRPNNVSGWGRVDLTFLEAPAPYTLWLDDHTGGLETNQSVNYSHSLAHPLEVVADDQPLRVMLTWTDPPASLSASIQLVNDLDLIVIGPDGQAYYGNNIASGDRINNVEGVIVSKPPVGRYEIQVQAFNIPIASQPYALAVAGPLARLEGASLTLTKSANVNTASVGQTITYTYHVTNSGAVTITGLTGRDDTVGAVTFSPPTIAPGQDAAGALTYTVQSGDLPGPLVNRVTVTGTTTISPFIILTRTAVATLNLQSNITEDIKSYLPIIFKSEP
jgi:uncharacterized repeat protein (TIGR01451 family)